jgi:hypothetical protein
MDISSLKAKYDALRGEVHHKAQILKGLDGESADEIPEKDDLFIRDCPVQCEGSVRYYSGRLVRGGPEELKALDIEEKTSEGDRARYVFEKTESDGMTMERVLKKTDSHKLKAEVHEKDSEAPRVLLEEIRFVEAGLSPDIEERSENLKHTILDLADRVKGLNAAGGGGDKSPEEITLNNVAVPSDEGTVLIVSGKIIREPADGAYSTIDLAVSGDNRPRVEYYFARSKDYDFYKRAEDDEKESTQIFDKDGPKLVLFTEEHQFSL